MSRGLSIEPIAVVGMACRFPSGLNNLQILWKSLQTRFNAIRETPIERWDADRFYSQIEASRGKAYVRRAVTSTKALESSTPISSVSRLETPRTWILNSA